MIVRPEAEADLRQARAWYERQRSGLGTEFILCVEEVLERIDRNPEGYAVVYEGLRRAMTRRFPYAVYFRIAEGEVVIVGVFHMRRHPQKWQQRSKL